MRELYVEAMTTKLARMTAGGVLISLHRLDIHTSNYQQELRYPRG